MNIPRDELLIHRAVEGEATDADWDELKLIAANDSEVWSRLAGSLRVETELRRSGHESLAIADRVALPGDQTPRNPIADESRSTAVHWAAWSGWAASLLFLVLWLFQALPEDPNRASPHNLVATDVESPVETPASPVTKPTLDELYESYVRRGSDEGRIVQSLDPYVVKAVSDPNSGGVKLLLIRSTLEEKRVDQLYQPALTDSGRIAPVPIDNSRWSSSSL